MKINSTQLQLIENYLLKQNYILAALPPREVKNYDFIYVIPCYNEPDLENLLQSLRAAHAPTLATALIFVINDSEEDSPQVKQTNIETYEFLISEANNWTFPFTLIPLYFSNLPSPKAGVGLARKLGMDLAAQLFYRHGKPQGVIISLDADCQVAENYFCEIESFFLRNSTLVGTSLYFEHPIEKADPSIVEGIIQYELYMRYHLQALRWCRFPYSFHTVGSCMATRAYAYAAVGGMNTRKAGEDFYFLHKLIPYGNFAEISTTCVYPSARVSTRTPFGTGKTLLDWQLGKLQYVAAAPLESYQAMRDFFSLLPYYFFQDIQQSTQKTASLPFFMRSFLEQVKWIKKLDEIKKQTKSLETFTKRFFQWWNAFWIIKYLHYAREVAFPDIPVSEAAITLLKKLNEQKGKSKEHSIESTGTFELLKIYRNVEKNYPHAFSKNHK
ncbi:MAG: hypothetical protein RML72_06350 [Bacteroidia bacterium]|nr:hypothetical protein [Bacteroidia bacterium]MDW8158479.1 hypothetical protein [Bacteroidia bacterium]